MSRSVLSTLAGLFAMLLALSGTALAESKDRDTVEIIQTPGGAYVSCFDLFVTNRQTTRTPITEFRLRIITDGARFVNGASGSPLQWTIFQTPDSVIWRSNGAAFDIDSGETLSGFRICVRDTGVFRLVWETADIDSVISHDTLAFAARRGNCDEAFFNVIPSDDRCVVDIDLVAGNVLGLPVNDFHLHMITPGATFQTGAQPVPQGWVRTRARFDSISYAATTRPLMRNMFAERFRIELDEPADSVIRIEWWSTNFGDPLCRDTAVIRCGLSRPDSVTRDLLSGGDTCCANLRLKNTHLPASPLDGFSLKVTTPNVRITNESAAPRWTRSALNQAGDSLAYIITDDPANGLRSGDSAVFGNLCFDNTGAATDTIRYTWRTFRRGVQVSSGTGFRICLRPLTGCDSVAVVNTSVESTQSCISLVLGNRNSRGSAITRFVVRFSNPGAVRSIRSATAPSGWIVQRFAADSIVWTGSPLLSGRSLQPFTFCISNGDGSGNPVSIAWFTSNAGGPICADTVRVNTNTQAGCDSIEISEFGSTDPTSCCYTIRLKNRNAGNRPINRVRLIAQGGFSFSSATAPAPWTVVGTPIVSDLSYTGPAVAAGASTPEFTFCVRGGQIPEPPGTINITWYSYDGDNLVCIDTLRLTCAGDGGVVCDTVPLISQRDSSGVGCTYGFRVVNTHLPMGTVNGVQFRIVTFSGVFGNAVATGDAAGWSTVDLQRQLVTFRGATLPHGDSVETFSIRVDSSLGSPVAIEASTMIDDRVVCTSLHNLQCVVSGVNLPLMPTGFRLADVRPDPFRTVTEIGYQLLRPADVTFIIHDELGAEVRRINRGREDMGSHTLLLDMSAYPTGVYFYTLEAGGESMTRRMVMVR